MKRAWVFLLEKVRAFFRRSDFFRQLTILVSGGTVAQIIPVLVSPLLSRLYSPESFGVFAFYMSLVSLFSVIASARYEMAILLPAKDEDAWALFTASSWIILGTACLSFGFLLVFGRSLMGLFNISGDTRILFFAPLAILLTGMVNLFNYWMLRCKRFKLISGSRIVQSGIQAGGQAGLGFCGPFGLVLGQALGIAGSGFFLMRNIRFRPISIPKLLKENLRRYANFPKYNLPHALTDAVRSNAVSFLIPVFFSSSALGLYYFAMKAISTPVALIGSAISQVYFQRSAERVQRGGGLGVMTGKLILLLLAVGVPVFILIYIFAPFLFGLIFGSRWSRAGLFARYLSPYMLASFLASSLSQLPAVLGRQRAMFFFSLFGNGLIVAAFLYGGLVKRDLLAVFMFLSSVVSLYFVVLILWFFHIAWRSSSSSAEVS